MARTTVQVSQVMKMLRTDVGSLLFHVINTSLNRVLIRDWDPGEKDPDSAMGKQK